MNKSTAISILLALGIGLAEAQTLTVRVEPGSGQPVLPVSDITHAGYFTGTANAVRFDLYVEAVNGAPQPPSDPYLGFCAELQQEVAFGSSYDYQLVPLTSLNGGLITPARAARLGYLFDNYATGMAPSDWPASAFSAKGTAFQTAVWELAFDDDLSLANPGSFTVGAQADATVQNSLLLAQSWLDAIAAANVPADYVPQRWDIRGLANPEQQDLLMARLIPEPGTLTLLGFLAIPFFRRRR